MEVFRQIMGFLAFALSIYSLVVLVRIIMSWVPGANLGRAGEYIGRIVDPYLNWFRQFTMFRVGRFDFSVLAGLIALSVLTSICAELAVTARISIGIILAIVFVRVMGTVNFLLTIFLILAVVRLLGEFFQADTATGFWIRVDQIVEPMVHAVVYRIVRDRELSYRNALIVFSLAVLAVIIVARLLTPIIGVALRSLPV